MARIKRASRSDTVPVFEDPRPSKNTVYLEHQAHDKTTLATKFGGTLRMRTSSSNEDFNAYASGNYIQLQNTSTTSGRAGSSYTMGVTKEAAYCWHYEGANGASALNNVDWWNFFCIDPTITSGPMQRIVDSSTNDELILYQSRISYYNWYYQHAWFNPSSDKEMHELNPTTVGGYTGSTNSTDHQQPVFWTVKDPNSDRVSGISGKFRYNYIYRPWMGIARNSFSSFSDSNDKFDINLANPYWYMYIGQSTQDGQPIYLATHHDTDYTHYVRRHNVSSDNTTTLFSSTSAPAASGTSYGGARTMNATIGQVQKISSKHFDDPGATDKCWYVPYFDTSYNYHPWVFRWDQSNDTFTRDQATNITGDLSSTHMLNLPGTTNDNYGFLGVVWNETFVNGGNRYLTVMYLCGEHRRVDSEASARTFVTYSVDAADPTLLTHHSTVTIPETAKQAVFLNDAKTLLGVFGVDAFYIYNWDNTNGWTLTTTLAEKAFAVGRDSTDRIWMVAGGNDSGYADIHVITPTVPVRITITPAQSSYNHTGSDINSTVDVSAYNIAGERIATNVELSIDGSTMTFSGGATTATVTTSTSAETSVNIVVTGAGLSDIVANVSI